MRFGKPRSLKKSLVIARSASDEAISSTKIASLTLAMTGTFYTKKGFLRDLKPLITA